MLLTYMCRFVTLQHIRLATFVCMLAMHAVTAGMHDSTVSCTCFLRHMGEGSRDAGKRCITLSTALMLKTKATAAVITTVCVQAGAGEAGSAAARVADARS